MDSGLTKYDQRSVERDRDAICELFSNRDEGDTINDCDLHKIVTNVASASGRSPQ